MVTFPKSVYTLSEYIVLESWTGTLAVLFLFPVLTDNIGIQEVDLKQLACIFWIIWPYYSAPSCFTCH